MEATREPSTVGLKSAVNVQLLPLPRAAAAQPSLVMGKSPGFGPPGVTLLMVTGLALTLVTVTVCGAVVLPILVLGKTKLKGEMLSAGRPENPPMAVPKWGLGEPAYSA